MNRISVKSVAILDVRAEDVYHTLADYRNGHPLIVPKETFFDFRVERGGYGAGTVIRFKMRVLGVERELYQRVSEPEPGRILVEHDIASLQDIITTFTVDPVENAHKARVQIETTLLPTPGLAGFSERLLIPIINKQIYRKELKLLEAFVQKKSLLATK